MLNHFFLFCLFFLFFSKVRVGAKEGGSHYWEMAVAITCGYGGYLLPLLAAHSSFYSFTSAKLQSNLPHLICSLCFVGYGMTFIDPTLIHRFNNTLINHISLIL